MVGTRRNLLSKNSSYTKVQNGLDNGNSDIRQDIESGYGTINPRKTQHRFRDAIKQTMYSNRANEMKKKLIDNVDHEALEIYRKSDQSVSIPCSIAWSSVLLTPHSPAPMHTQQEAARFLRGAKPPARRLVGSGHGCVFACGRHRRQYAPTGYGWRWCRRGQGAVRHKWREPRALPAGG
jgi:hypothetical protein